jgi:hypothetical protein
MVARKGGAVDKSLASLKPDLASQWHHTRNGDKTPQDVTPGSHFNAWWACEVAEDHVWQTKVQNRALQGQGCPFCAGRRPSSTTNLLKWCLENGDFGNLLITQFDHKRNQISLTAVTPGSHTSLWWRCTDCSELFQATPNRRTSMRTICPFCAGRRVSRKTSLAALHPDLVQLWDHDRNADLSPRDLTPGSAKVVWWRCEKGQDHAWRNAVSAQTAKGGRGCPFCAGNRASSTYSLEQSHPEIAAQWHKTKNGELAASQVTPGSGRRVWWQCDNYPGHEWQMAVTARTAQGQGCPYCANRRVHDHNSLKDVAPEVAAYFDESRNGVSATDILATSSKRLWWRCLNGPDHQWLDSPRALIARKQACPFCPPRLMRLSITNSFASWCSVNGERGQRLLAEWDGFANKGLTPEAIIYMNQRRKVHWTCTIATDHRWASSLYERVVDGVDCPYCNRRKASSTNNLLTLYPELVALLHPTLNDGVDPSTISPTSHIKLWWKCPNGPDHIWEATLNSMKGHPRCGFCAGKKVSVTNSLANRFPDVAAEFDLALNVPETPETVTFGSGKKYWWRCAANQEHVWSAQVSSRTGALRTGCPSCVIAPRSRREIQLSHEIGGFFEIDQSDHRVRVGTRTFDCDIVLRNEGIIVEYDGSFWHQSKHEVDKSKTDELVSGGWKVLRVREQPLVAIGPLDISCSEYEPLADVAIKVLHQIQELSGIPIHGLDKYVTERRTRCDDAARAYIDELINSPDYLRQKRVQASWDRYFEELAAFVSQHGTADPSTIPGASRKLITWVRRQRQLYAERLLPENCILQLEALPGWGWSRMDFRWMRQFERLLDFRDSNGHLLRQVPDSVLRSWMVHQRVLYKRNQLDVEKTRLLEDVPGWTWNPGDDRWESGFQYLLEYIELNGTSCVPQKFRTDGFGLGTWVNKQRQRYRKGNLERARADRLSLLPGWTWSPNASEA